MSATAKNPFQVRGRVPGLGPSDKGAAMLFAANAESEAEALDLVRRLRTAAENLEVVGRVSDGLAGTMKLAPGKACVLAGAV